METLQITSERVVYINQELEAVDIKFTEIGTTGKSQKEVRRNIPGIYQHRNYLDYLRMCWVHHRGAVVSPDLIWHVVANEIATNIKDNATKYASMFTTTPGTKQEIRVMTGDPQLLPLDSIELELMLRVPSDVNLFIPNFTTTNKNAHFAFIAAFADAMQVYYNYSMMMCGIPKIKILGTDEDWNKLIENLGKLKTMLFNVRPGYFEDVIDLIGKIKGPAEAGFYESIISLERCGSGGQKVLSGWITKLFMKKPNPGYLENYSSLISKVPYKFLETGQNFELSYGLFGSSVRDGYLVPEFGFIINEVIE